MKFWVYMTTVVLSIPKTIVFVALGAPSSEGKEGAKVGKVIAIGVVVIISSKFRRTTHGISRDEVVVC